MKKWICAIIAVCLATALAGCGRRGDIQNPAIENTEQEITQTTQTDATEETEETLAHNTGEAELDFSDFE